jgi:predicted ATPase
MQTIQSQHFLCYLIGLLADAHAIAGNHTEALNAAEHGLILAETTGERFYTAELQRLRGELLARKSRARAGEAERAFTTAIELAKVQGAKTLERKAKNSLLRCRR